MARCCGGTGSCACKIEPGGRIAISGLGSLQDPFVISGDVGFKTTDNDTFDLGLTGDGTEDDPWNITVTFATTAKLVDMPDVTGVPTNGQVLGWNSSTQKWEPKAPTAAASGSVATDTSLSGDGSVETVLQVREDPDRYLSTDAEGLGLNDDGINSIVRHFPDAASRTTADPAPVLNSLSILDSDPGRIDYWTGTEWAPQPTNVEVEAAGELVGLSGSYAGGPVVLFIKQFEEVTDSEGVFDVLSTTDLLGRAGVLAATVQESGSQAWQALVNAGTDTVQATAFRMDDGTLLASTSVTGTVTAWLY